MSETPNVLLIVMDAVRPDHLSCYGYGRPTTPCLESLAARGVVFDRAFAPAPWTPPSHASLFTGTYPSRHGVDVGENLHLDGRLPTLAEILAARGYDTFAILPDPHLSEARGFHRGFGRFVEVFRLPWVAPDRDALVSLARNVLLGRDARAYHSTLLLKRWLAGRPDPRRPFFAFVNFKTAHNSYRSPRPFRRRFEVRPAPGQDRDRLRRYANGGGYRYMAGGLPMDERDLEVVRSWYDGAIACIDDRIRDLLEFLRRLGRRDNTLVVVTADHGENFGEHGLAYHLFCLYDTLIRVPLVVSLPGVLDSGTRVAGLVSLTDVLPTVLELVGAEPGPEVQGTSLLRLAREGGHPHVFAEFGRPRYMLERLSARHPTLDFSRFDRGLRCVRTPDLKLIVDSDGAEELYHLPSDPGETRNVLARRPEDAARLRRVLEDWQAGFTPAAVGGPAQQDDELMRKALMELGYF